LKHYVVVATHHKTGSVWMRTVFRSIGRSLGLPFVSLNKSRSKKSGHSPAPAILFNDHSNFSNCPWALGDPRSRILHIIRDPRDVIISAMRYHLSAKESWLHEPRKAFRGMSYQQTLNSLPDDRSRYAFEMERSAMRVIRDMQNWDYTRPNCFECKYEELIADTSMDLVTSILIHLGFELKDLKTCRQIFWDNSLFGGLRGSRSPHIRSGELRQWESVFDESLAISFTARFPDALIRLGYEPDNSWAAAGARSAGGTGDALA
jgi:hypothetical protein